MGFNPMGEFWKTLYRGTLAEHAIEPAIAALGLPYRTQYPFFLWGTKYFPDVLLPTIGVILEVDDESHDEDDKKAADALRTSAFEKLGYIVVRCTNDEALKAPSETVQRLITGPGHLKRKGPGLPPPPTKRPIKKKKK